MNLRTKRTLRLGLILGAALLLEYGCNTARRGAPVAPLEPVNAQVQRGQIIFYRACNSCHASGGASLGPALNNKPLPGWLIRFQVRQGLGAMPAFSEDQISDDELETLLAYLEALKKHEWPAAYLSSKPR